MKTTGLILVLLVAGCGEVTAMLDVDGGDAGGTGGASAGSAGTSGAAGEDGSAGATGAAGTTGVAGSGGSAAGGGGSGVVCQAPGQMMCSTGVCFDTRTDSANCGACGNACPANAACADSKCVCTTPGQILCGTPPPVSIAPHCIDPKTDERYCGNCATSCGTGVCDNGVCVSVGG